MAARILILTTLFCCGGVFAAHAQPAPEPIPSEAEAPSTEPATEEKQPQPPPIAPAPAPAPIPELPALRPADTDVAPAEELTLEDWNNASWSLKKPEFSLFELDGYFRGRFNILRGLDLGNGGAWEQTPRYSAQSGDAGERKANFTFANMRMRLRPTINVAEGISAHMSIDIFDNLILGSTPDVTFSSAGTPNTILSGGQATPQRGLNALRDSILIRRAYVDLRLLNEQVQLKFGRMPDHWGLGIVANAGDCLDCNYGSTADRASLSARFGAHLFSAMFDWTSSGPVREPFSGGQALDAVDWDNGRQYSLRVQRYQTIRQQKDALAHGRAVLNYGAWAALRQQPRSLKPSYYNSETAAPDAPINADEDGLGNYADNTFRGSVYAEYSAGPLKISIEAAGMIGKFNDFVRFENEPAEAQDNANVADAASATTISMWGAALESSYDLPEKDLVLGFKAGIASGDSAPGFGALDQADTQRGVFNKINGKTYTDRRLSNFQFHPDYQLGLLLYRRLIGTVTDSFYLRPEVTYAASDLVHGTLGVMYSQVLRKRSTPSSCSNVECEDGAVGATPLGFEVDFTLSYDVPADDSNRLGALRGALKGAVFVPMFGDNALRNNALSGEAADASLAWTIEAHLYMTF